MKVFFLSLPNRYDDYDYGEINQLLDRSFKVYIKTVVCTPEKTTKRMYDSFWRQFEHSEKVQSLCMLRHSHGPQISVSLSSHCKVLCCQAEISSPFLLPVCWVTADMDWANSEHYRELDMRMVQLHLNCTQYCLYPREAGKWCKIHPSLSSRPGTALWLAQGIFSPLVLLAWIAPKQFLC